VRVHLATEHSLELEFSDVHFEAFGVLLQVARCAFVVFAFRELEQLARIIDGLGRAVDLLEIRRQARTFFAQLLGTLGLRPDGRLLELAIDLFEPLFLAVVLKETPVTSWCALRGL
jgi:hypothetical protein